MHDTKGRVPGRGFEDTELLYQTLFNQSPDGILLLTTDGRLIAFNDAAPRRLGYSREEFAALRLADIDADDTPEAVRDRIAQITSQGSAAFDTRHRTKTGELRDVHVLVQVLTIGGRSLLHAIWHDSTDQKRAERELQESMRKAEHERAKLAAVVEAIGEGLSIRDTGYRLLYQNRVMVDMLGDHVGEPCYSAFHGLKRICDGCPVALSFQDGKVHTAERRIVGEEEEFFETTASPIQDADGRITGGIELVRDITARKRMEAALRRNEQRLRAIFEHSAVGIMIIDRDRRVLQANPAMAKILGYEPAELQGKNVSDFSHPDDDQRNHALYEEMRNGRNDYFRMEKRYIRKDGGVIWGRLTVSKLPDDAGRPEFAVAMVEDVTDRKHSEELLLKSHEELETLVQERTAELSMLNDQLRSLSAYLQEAREKERTIIAREVHDELGQSLTALKMDLSLLIRRLPREWTPAIEKAESMADLIESTIQTVKRISSELRPGILDHLGLIAALEWQAQEFERRTGVPCVVAFDPPDIELDRDRSTTVFRIFQETLTNVTRHARATGVDVLLQRRKGELVLTVKDNGRGINDREKNDPSSLGLLGMRERVLAWGGSLLLRGIPGKGTTVEVRIPLDPEEAEDLSLSAGQNRRP